MKGATLTPARLLPQESGCESNRAGLVLAQQFTEFEVSILQTVFCEKQKILNCLRSHKHFSIAAASFVGAKAVWAQSLVLVTSFERFGTKLQHCI